MSLTTGILQYGTGSHSTSSEEANGVATDFISQGVVGTISNTNGVAPSTGAMAVNAQASPNATVAVTAGYAYVTGTPTGQNSQTLRVRNTVSTNVSISANASGSTKYDWIYIKLDPTNMANPNAAADNVATFVTSRSSNATTDDGGSAPTYGYNIAVVTVANGFSTITNANIQDKRSRSGATASGTTTATTDWNTLGYTPSSVTALGNRSYSLLYSNVNLSTVLSPGMRNRFTRTVAAPTQCTSLNGTTQYYSKTSPAGMTFTNNFVVSAWVKLSSYAATDMMVASRYNGTSGWGFWINSSGQVYLSGFNASSVNQSRVHSYQSVPLNKWVHIAAQLDMSTFTATTTTSYVMIDGVDVPASVDRSGTNPTALVQAGNLEIGSANGGATPFPGKIAQVAIYSAKVTEANILATMAQGLVGTEASLISAYSFNNSINDLNANANNLTANGSAVATNADSPFGGQAGGTISSTLDYGIVQSVSFSTNTTVVVQVPEGCTIPTSGGVSAVVYSSNAAPYGFPKQKGKWTIGSLWLPATLLNTTLATWSSGVVNGTLALSVPTGEWTATLEAYQYSDIGSSVIITHTWSISTSNSSPNADRRFVGMADGGNGSGSSFLASNDYLTGPVSVATMTPYYALFKATTGSGNHQLNVNSDTGSYLEFENAYL